MAVLSDPPLPGHLLWGIHACGYPTTLQDLIDFIDGRSDGAMEVRLSEEHSAHTISFERVVNYSSTEGVRRHYWNAVHVQAGDEGLTHRLVLWQNLAHASQSGCAQGEAGGVVGNKRGMLEDVPMEQEEISGKPQDEADWRAEYCALLLEQLAGRGQDRLSAWPEPSVPVYLPRTLLEETVQPESDPRREGNRPTSLGGEERARQIMIKVPVKEKELWKKLDSDRVLLLEGPAGMGKTTWSVHLARECIARPDHLPIWVPFRDLVAEAGSVQNDAAWKEEASIRKYLIRKYDRSLGEQLYNQWGSSQAVLILDGLDEVVDPAQRVNVLKNLLSTGASSQRPLTILTSRPLGHNLPLVTEKIELQGLSPNEQIDLVSLYQSRLGLDDPQIEQFKQQVGLSGAKASSSTPVRSLLQRPGHLVAILRVYAKTGHVLETETEVLTYLLEARLTGRSESPADLAKKRQVLEGLALHLLACRQGQPQSRAQLLSLIEQVLQEHGASLFPLSKAPALLNDFVQNSGLLTRLGLEPERYQLESLIWQEYLAGGALANTRIMKVIGMTEEQVLKFLGKKAWDPEWESVLKSWMGHTDNPFPLFERLIDKAQDDLARHRLGTAGRCLFEVKPAIRDRPEYQTLSAQIPMEAFEAWKAAAELGREILVEDSLRGMWVETTIGRKKLMEVSRHEDRGFKKKAGMLLKLAGEALTDEDQRQFLAWLDDVDSSVQAMAVRALGTLGVGLSTEAYEALIARLMENRDRLVRDAAFDVLDRVGWIESPKGRLMGRKRYMQHASLEAMMTVQGGLSVKERRMLVAHATGPDIRLRTRAFFLFGALGPGLSTEERKALVGGMMDDEWRIREAALEAMMVAVQGGLSTEERRVLIARVVDPVGSVREAAIALLGTLGAGLSTEERRVLIARVVDSDSSVRVMAVRVLGALGAGLSTVERMALVVGAADPDERVRLAVVEALFSVQQEGLRFFQNGTAMSPGRLISDLSKAEPFADACSQTMNRVSPFILAT